MKANELMVGDWMYAIDGNGEKHPCRANDLKYDYTNKCDDFCVDFYGTGYDPEWPDVGFNVEPIPLTPEILEKNTSESNKNVFGGMNYALNADYFIENRGDRFCLSRRMAGHKYSTFWVCDIHFVHELQHALRLCGIDKEIVL